MSAQTFSLSLLQRSPGGASVHTVKSPMQTSQSKFLQTRKEEKTKTKTSFDIFIEDGQERLAPASSFEANLHQAEIQEQPTNEMSSIIVDPTTSCSSIVPSAERLAIRAPEVNGNKVTDEEDDNSISPPYRRSSHEDYPTEDQERTVDNDKARKADSSAGNGSSALLRQQQDDEPNPERVKSTAVPTPSDISSSDLSLPNAQQIARIDTRFEATQSALQHIQATSRLLLQQHSAAQIPFAALHRQQRMLNEQLLLSQTPRISYMNPTSSTAFHAQHTGLTPFLLQQQQQNAALAYHLGQQPGMLFQNYNTPQAMHQPSYLQQPIHQPALAALLAKPPPSKMSDSTSLPLPSTQGGARSQYIIRAGSIIAHSEIAEVDVLLERGAKGNRHKGSQHYRRLINERRPSYQELPESSRGAKKAVAQEVVETLKKTGARFVHKKSGQYIIMTDREARNKISQALREKRERTMVDGFDEK